MRTFSYQNKRKKNYFEGWYTRFNTSDGIEFAVIFAVTKYEKDPHCFIQFFSENDDECLYLKFDISEFKYENDSVIINKHKLTKDKVSLNTNELNVDVTINNQLYLKDINLKESAMGILEKAPLECFQEVIFMNAKSEGNVKVKNKDYIINGTSYMEKTYGSKFPTKWIWIQSNKNAENQISFSIGKVPVLGRISINGFLCVLNTKERSYYFSTSNLSKIKISGTSDQPVIVIRKNGFVLKLFPEKSKDVLLVGPTQKGQMILNVFESLNSSLNIKLFHKKKLILDENFSKVGYEQMYL